MNNETPQNNTQIINDDSLDAHTLAEKVLAVNGHLPVQVNDLAAYNQRCIKAGFDHAQAICVGDMRFVRAASIDGELTIQGSYDLREWYNIPFYSNYIDPREILVKCDRCKKHNYKYKMNETKDYLHGKETIVSRVCVDCLEKGL